MIGPPFDIFTAAMFFFYMIPKKCARLKEHYIFFVIGFDLSKSAKLAVIWVILNGYNIVDVIMDSVLIILVFYCEFGAFGIILFYIASFFIRE